MTCPAPTNPARNFMILTQPAGFRARKRRELFGCTRHLFVTGPCPSARSSLTGPDGESRRGEGGRNGQWLGIQERTAGPVIIRLSLLRPPKGSQANNPPPGSLTRFRDEVCSMPYWKFACRWVVRFHHPSVLSVCLPECDQGTSLAGRCQIPAHSHSAQSVGRRPLTSGQVDGCHAATCRSPPVWVSSWPIARCWLTLPVRWAADGERGHHESPTHQLIHPSIHPPSSLALTRTCLGWAGCAVFGATVLPGLMMTDISHHRVCLCARLRLSPSPPFSSSDLLPFLSPFLLRYLTPCQ